MERIFGENNLLNDLIPEIKLPDNIETPLLGEHNYKDEINKFNECIYSKEFIDGLENYCTTFLDNVNKKVESGDTNEQIQLSAFQGLSSMLVQYINEDSIHVLESLSTFYKSYVKNLIENINNNQQSPEFNKDLIKDSIDICINITDKIENLPKENNN